MTSSAKLWLMPSWHETIVAWTPSMSWPRWSMYERLVKRIAGHRGSSISGFGGLGNGGRGGSEARRLSTSAFFFAARASRACSGVVAQCVFQSEQPETGSSHSAHQQCLQWFGASDGQAVESCQRVDS